MYIIQIVNIAALIIVPLLSVCIAHWLHVKSEKRKDKMAIFKTLMTSRIYGWTNESVNALNIIDIVFADDKAVCSAWKKYYEMLCVQNPDKKKIDEIQLAQYKLLETMASALGYKDVITWEAVQKPYRPRGMDAMIAANQINQQNYSMLLDRMVKATPDVIQKNEENDITNRESN